MQTNSALRLASASALGTLVAICGLGASAQAPETTIEVIVVRAPWHFVDRKVVGETPSGGEVEQISLTRRVDVSDLDLRRHADVVELEKRVGDMARESCGWLAEMFPIEHPDTQRCASDATKDAMAQAQEAISAAAAADKEERNRNVATAPGNE